MGKGNIKTFLATRRAEFSNNEEARRLNLKLQTPKEKRLVFSTIKQPFWGAEEGPLNAYEARLLAN